MDAFPKPLPASIDDRDMLTGLPGVDAACAWLDRAGQDGFAQAMLVGLHRFQSVNLAYGKAAGDRVLAEIARRIVDFAREELGTQGFVARMGGGEFLVASTVAASRERWQWQAEALARSIARPIPLAGDQLRLAPRTALLRGQPGERGAPCGRTARTRYGGAAPRGWKRTLSARSTGPRSRCCSSRSSPWRMAA